MLDTVSDDACDIVCVLGEDTSVAKPSPDHRPGLLVGDLPRLDRRHEAVRHESVLLIPMEVCVARVHRVLALHQGMGVRAD